MKSKYKRLHLLTKRLSDLIDEEMELFLFERKRFDWLGMEQMENKYPNLQEAIEENQMAINEVLKELLPTKHEVSYEQAELIFNS